MIKQYLLNTGYFVNNQYLDDYIDLIQKPFSLPNYAEYHHILPISYYKYKYGCKNRKEAKLFADHDLNNLKIKLSYADYCKAHWLLYNCTKDKLKEDMATAFLYMIDRKTNKILLSTGLSEQEYKKLQSYRDDLVNSTRSKYYSEKEKQFLIENASIMTLKSMAKQLNRSIESINQQLRIIGIKRIKNKNVDHRQNKIISIEISNELDDIITKMATKSDITKSELIRQILMAKLNI